MRTFAFIILATQLFYSCYCQEDGGSSPPMPTPPMPTLPPMKTTANMMVPPSPAGSDNGGSSPMKTPPMPTLPPTQQTTPAVNASPSSSSNANTSPSTSAPNTSPISSTSGSTVAASDDCMDKRPDCRSYGAQACIGIYESWAKYNCPRHCGFCVNPDDTKVECKDNLQYCDNYDSEMCTAPEYRLFAEDNCKKYCNLCDSKPLVNTGSNALQPSQKPDTGSNSTCKDTVDYCWTEPDANCFGIYEPWARGHCPYRCFFCDEKPPCEDKLDYCSQYDSSACSDPSFINWARLNCRKTCNLCAPPTPPSGVKPPATSPSGTNQGTTSSGTGTGSGSVTSGTGSGSVSPSNNPVNAPTTKPGTSSPGSLPNVNTNITIPSGSVISGAKNTFIIQGPKPLLDGTCYYKGENHLQDKVWYDGCDYICNCLDAKRNRIICTERCTNWRNTVALDGCSWVQESGDCCKQLECNVN